MGKRNNPTSTAIVVNSPIATVADKCGCSTAREAQQATNAGYARLEFVGRIHGAKPF